jgi:hypothetical protein
LNLSLANQWKAPIFSSFLEKRTDGAVLAGVGLLHLGFSFAGLPFWVCPIRAATGIPCPGCGLTHAVFELLGGDIYASIQTHAFAPLFLFAFSLILVSLILPEKLAKAMTARIKLIEVRSGVLPILLVLLMFYWLLRISGVIPFPKPF